MKLGTVLGAVWATKKLDGLSGKILQAVKTDTGVVIAVDTVGAGTGEQVLLAFGSAARTAAPGCPADAAIVGILDRAGFFHDAPTGAPSGQSSR